MRYDAQSGRIVMTAAELVWYARRRTALTYHDESEERGIADADASTRRRLVGTDAPERLTYDCEAEGVRFTVLADADAIDGTHVTLLRKVPGRAAAPDRDAVKQARGELFCALCILTESLGRVADGEILYLGEEDEFPHRAAEAPSRADMTRFFEKLLASAAVHAAPEIDRVTRRLPAIAAARFPYGEMREGQRELMETVYTTVRRRGRLYACAPTGIGKTIATLYPALRAMGDGYCEKIFYLTPKNTAGIAAAEALRRLADTGIPVRGVMLTAKETICPHRLKCRHHETCELSPLAAERQDMAARELLASENPAVTSADILAVSRTYRVCPYELSLRYSQYCDVVICDYNYLFDPRVALKRYFVSGGNYTILVDEAHNLVERARAIWSKSLSLCDIDRLIALSAPLPRLSAAAKNFREVLVRVVTEGTAAEMQEGADGSVRGFFATEELPEGLYPALCALLYAFEECFEARVSREYAERLNPIYYELRDTLDRMGDYDAHFTTFLTRDGEEMSVRTICLDPAGVVNERLSRGGSAVLFSATLTPLDYYREVLGGRRGDRTLEVPSPFDESHLCVAVMDKISTRYPEREETVRAVVHAILTAVKTKPGNYMVFCPSYHYMMRVHDALHAAVPKLATLVQKKDMTQTEREAFLAAFDAHAKSALVGFSVMGGIYSEGVDLVGRRLIGAVIVGVGLPSLSDEREAIRAYFDEKTEEGRAYAYVFPGMNRVLQAAGRVIRTEEDRGVVLLIDDRFASPEYRNLIPAHWQGLKYVGDKTALSRLLERFWHPQTDR